MSVSVRGACTGTRVNETKQGRGGRSLASFAPSVIKIAHDGAGERILSAMSKQSSICVCDLPRRLLTLPPQFAHAHL